MSDVIVKRPILIGLALALALTSSIAWVTAVLGTPSAPANNSRMFVLHKQGMMRLSPSGLGPIHFGMDVTEADRAIGSPISVEAGINGCSFWTVPRVRRGTQLIALRGRLAYALVYQRGTATTRAIRVGDGLTRLHHRYRGRLHGGRSASLSGADQRLFVSKRKGGAIYELEFDIVRSRVAFISAGTRHVIETFGECS
jgi:hypothetical protein